METTPKANVNLRQPAVYIAQYFVNRFQLVKQSGFTLGYFGLIDDSGKLLDYIGLIFTDSVLKELRENLVGYSAKIGTAKKKIPLWSPEFGETGKARSPIEGFGISRYGIVDFIHLTNWEDAYAEICFWSYSRAGLGDFIAQKGGGDFPVWGLALLRCDIDLQRQFLEALYPP